MRVNGQLGGNGRVSDRPIDILNTKGFLPGDKYAASSH